MWREGRIMFEKIVSMLKTLIQVIMEMIEKRNLREVSFWIRSVSSVIFLLTWLMSAWPIVQEYVTIEYRKIYDFPWHFFAENVVVISIVWWIIEILYIWLCAPFSKNKDIFFTMTATWSLLSFAYSVSILLYSALCMIKELSGQPFSGTEWFMVCLGVVYLVVHELIRQKSWEYASYKRITGETGYRDCENRKIHEDDHVNYNGIEYRVEKMSPLLRKSLNDQKNLWADENEKTDDRYVLVNLYHKTIPLQEAVEDKNSELRVIDFDEE